MKQHSPALGFSVGNYQRQQYEQIHGAGLIGKKRCPSQKPGWVDSLNKVQTHPHRCQCIFRNA